jgi:hypothetical protein
VVVGRQCLDKWVVLPIAALKFSRELGKCSSTLIPAIGTPMLGRSKCHVLISFSSLSGGAVVVICAGNYAAMNF